VGADASAGVVDASTGVADASAGEVACPVADFEGADASAGVADSSAGVGSCLTVIAEGVTESASSLNTFYLCASARDKKIRARKNKSVGAAGGRACAERHGGKGRREGRRAGVDVPWGLTVA